MFYGCLEGICRVSGGSLECIVGVWMCLDGVCKVIQVNILQIYSQFLIILGLFNNISLRIFINFLASLSPEGYQKTFLISAAKSLLLVVQCSYVSGRSQ